MTEEQCLVAAAKGPADAVEYDLAKRYSWKDDAAYEGGSSESVD